MQVSNRTIFQVLTGITLYVGVLWLALLLKTQLIWIGTAMFLALAINPLVERLTPRMPRKSRGLGVGLIFAALLLAFSGAIYLLVPPLVSQTQHLINDLPGYVERLRDNDSVMGDLIERYEVVEKLRSGEFAGQINGVRQSAVGFARGAFDGIIATISIMTLTFFMLLEGPAWIRRFWSLQKPSKERDHRKNLADQMYKVIAGYVTGRLFLALIATVATAIALTLIGVPFAIPLGIVVGLLDLVPLVGATLGALIVVTVALFSSLSAAVFTAIFFLIYQQVENNVLQPLIDSRTVQVSPLTVFLAAIIGVTLGGLVGALVSIPLAGCAQILVRDWLRNHDR